MTLLRLATLHAMVAVAVVVVTAGALGTARGEAPRDDCQLGFDAARRGDQPTALLHLELCLESNPSAEVRVRAKKAHRAVGAKLEAGRFGEVVLAIEPPAAIVRVAAIKTSIPAGRTIYLPVGRHELIASLSGFREQRQTLTIEGRERATIVFTLEAEAAPVAATPATANVDFDTEPPPALPASRPQVASEFPSLIPDKLARGQPRDELADGGPKTPRWPWAIVAIGAAVGGAGVVAHVSGRQALAVGLYLGGAGLIGGGGAALALTRPRPVAAPDPPLELGHAGGSMLSIGYQAAW